MIKQSAFSKIWTVFFLLKAVICETTSPANPKQEEGFTKWKEALNDASLRTLFDEYVWKASEDDQKEDEAESEFSYASLGADWGIKFPFCLEP